MLTMAHAGNGAIVSMTLNYTVPSQTPARDPHNAR